MTDNRKHTRFTVLCNADYINIEVTVINISRDGMKVKSSYILDHKENIVFSIVLPSLDIIKIVGDIIWEKKIADHEYQYGVKINKISEEQESTFLSFIYCLEDEKN